MDPNSVFFKQAKLLLDLLPFINQEPCFALKGGTAINFFLRDLPRLSVDLDLVYIYRDPRREAISNSVDALMRISESIEKHSSIRVNRTRAQGGMTKLLAQLPGVTVKIELSPVLRGFVFPPKKMTVSRKVEETLGFAETLVMSFEDIWAGKMCAGLDRQHPRDLFDLEWLLQQGISEDLKKTFLVYAVSHNRPISELLNPNFHDLSQVFEQEFRRMTSEPIPLSRLEEIRVNLKHAVLTILTPEDKEFLLSFKKGSPRWELLGIDGARSLPAPNWKLYNILQMDMHKRSQALEKLENILH